MTWTYSNIGDRLSQPSGIVELMDDLGAALSGDSGQSMLMMGGGNPAHIPAVGEIWRQRLREIVADADLCHRMLANYDPPAGRWAFRVSVAAALTERYGWQIGPENVAVTCGGQSAFFILFSLFAGRCPGGLERRILLPLVPEYIGYADQGLDESIFHGLVPRIEDCGQQVFKYHIDFDSLAISPEIGGICVSRPTNPTGNVLTAEEVARLAELARRHNVPLIIDNAYGAPFPNAVFEDIELTWNRDVILTFSLSKLGLPGTRTGIVVAREDVITKVAAMSSIVSLANNNVGQAIVRPMLENGELIRISNDLIRPFYRQKSQQAQALVRERFADKFPYAMHRSEGAFFLWLWFPELPITSRELYQRLKQRGVLVVPGEYFFYGLEAVHDEWPHRTQCIRVTFSQPHDVVARGFELMADELCRIHSG